MTNNAQLLPQIDVRFQSGNSVPVERTYITAEEWAQIRDAIACIETSKPADALVRLPNIITGEVPFVEFFMKNQDEPDSPNKSVGALWGTGGVLSFTGNADESAKIFFQHVIDPNKWRLESEALEQATAEIAKRDASIEVLSGIIDGLNEVSTILQNKHQSELTTLRAKLAGVEGLVEALKLIVRVNACDYEYQRWAKEALATYEAVQGATK